MYSNYNQYYNKDYNEGYQSSQNYDTPPPTLPSSSQSTYSREYQNEYSNEYQNKYQNEYQSDNQSKYQSDYQVSPENSHQPSTAQSSNWDYNDQADTHTQYPETSHDSHPNYPGYSYNQGSNTPVNDEYDTTGYTSSQYPYEQDNYTQNTYTESPAEDGDYENGTNYEYESPLKALENKRSTADDYSNAPKNTFLKKIVNIFDTKTEIPDHKRPPPVKIDPNIPSDISALFKTNICQLCDVKLNSRTQAKTHYDGKPHAKKLKATLDKRFGKTSGDEETPSSTNNATVTTNDTTTTATSAMTASNKSTDDSLSSPPAKKKKLITDGTQLYCKCCDLSFTSTDHATQHYLGRNHQRVLHGLKPLKTGYFNKDTGKWQRSPTDLVTSTERIMPTDSDNSDLDGSKEKGGYFCNVCGVAATSKDQLDGHLQGVKHKKTQQMSNKKKYQSGSDSILASVIKGYETKKAKTSHKPKDFSIYRTPSGNFYCSPCDLTLNSECQFAQHVESKKHKIKKK